jgi:hypothetical protein
VRPHLPSTESVRASFTAAQFGDEPADVMKVWGQDDATIAGASMGGGSGSMQLIDLDRYLNLRWAEHVPAQYRIRRPGADPV